MLPAEPRRQVLSQSLSRYSRVMLQGMQMQRSNSVERLPRCDDRLATTEMVVEATIALKVEIDTSWCVGFLRVSHIACLDVRRYVGRTYKWNIKKILQHVRTLWDLSFIDIPDSISQERSVRPPRFIQSPQYPINHWTLLVPPIANKITHQTSKLWCCHLPSSFCLFHHLPVSPNPKRYSFIWYN